MFDDLGQFFETMVLAAAALLPIVNPLGGAPVYLAKTVDLDDAAHAELAKRVALNSFFLLLASALIGAYVLDFFGLSVPIVRIAGGSVVCAIAWSLLQQPDTPGIEATNAARAITPGDLRRRAFYPLTMPLTVGPGSISVAITLGANPPPSTRALIVTALGHVAGMLLVAASIYVCYRYADTILRKLGDVGAIVVTRLSAFILLCIGVQIIWNGAAVLLKL